MDSKRGLSAPPWQAGQLSVWAWRLQGAVQASSIFFTTVLWILPLGLYSWPASQPQVSRTGPGNQGLSPYTSGFLHMCALGNSNPYDWKGKAGAAWTRYILCLHGLLSKVACVECTRLVVVAPEAAPRDPPTLLHGLHK